VPNFLRKRLSPLAPFLQFVTGFWARAECRADDYGADLLAGGFPDPVEIMSGQTRFALKNSLTLDMSTWYTRFQARMLAWSRLHNLRGLKKSAHLRQSTASQSKVSRISVSPEKSTMSQENG
jgi:hypothetical protein